MSERHYFVTGAAGFVGRHLCQHLRQAGHRVSGLARRPDAALEALGVCVVQGDLAKIGAWQEHLAGVDYVIHCAAQASFKGGRDYVAVNVTGTRALLDAIRQAAPGLRRFVFVSTIGAIDRARGDACAAPLTENSPAHPSSEYGKSKWRAEQDIRTAGLPFSIVRPAMVVGADMRQDSHFAVFVRAARQGSLLARLAWPGEFSVVHVDDLVAALDLCTTHPAAANRTFFCAGAPLSLRDCFATVQPGGTRLPLEWAGAMATQAPWLFPFQLKALLRPALTASDAALRELGWQPRHTALEALRDVISRESARLDPETDPGGQTIVTGAASGLGRAVVARLAAPRKHLLLVDRDAAGLGEMRRRFPHCETAVVDLADEAAVAAFVQSPAWRAHPIREIFACAGMGIRGATLEADAARHARLFKLNVLARLALTHAALPGMIRHQFGRVVWISSSSAFQPLPYMASYAASNSALLQLGEAWGAELEGTGVHLMQVCPGGMQTNFQQSSGVKQIEGEKLMSPETVADYILRGLAQRKSTLLVSGRSHAMALLARVLPRAMSVALWKRLMTKLR